MSKALPEYLEQRVISGLKKLTSLTLSTPRQTTITLEDPLDGMIWVDFGKDILYVSRKFCEKFGAMKYYVSRDRGRWDECHYPELIDRINDIVKKYYNLP